MKKLISILIILSVSNLSLAQKEANFGDDVKVGLVLSGGGAKGLAHIGALKVIDSAGVKLDYIAGSSMGAIIGGLYASGYTGKQLDSLFHTVSFNDLIQDNLPRRSKTFYEKEDAEKYALTLPVVDKKISLPKGISNGQNFYNFYSKVTTHVKDVTDFSQLPVPFFCTATNIETGQRIVFDKGYLPDVIVASGALPTIYSPVLYDGKLITDGGVTDNYPVEEIKKRGADIVIGVDVQDTLMNREKLKSVTDIMLQISNFRTIKAMKNKRPKTDVYIRPDIMKFSVVGFNDGKAIIKEGEKEAIAEIKKLQAIAKYQKNKPQKKPLIPIKSLSINNLKIQKNKNYSRAYIKGKMRIKLPSKISLDKLNKGFDNLYATKNFQNIRYKITTDAFSKKNTLSLNVTEQKIKSYFRFGLHYDDLYKSAAIVNYTRKKLLTQNDILSLDAIVGDNPRYTIDYYIDKGYYWSVGFHHYLYNYKRELAFNIIKTPRALPNVNVNFINVNYLDITSQFYLETLLNNSFAFRLGLEHKYLHIDTNTVGVDENNIPGTVLDEISYYSLFSDIKYDSLDDKYFPTKGVLFEGSFSGYPFSSQNSSIFDEFAIAKANIKSAVSLTKNVSLLTEASGGFRIGRSTGVNSLDFFLGGYGSKLINNQIPFYGRDFFELSGDSFIKGAFTLDFEPFNKHHFNATANYANVGERFLGLENLFQLRGLSGYAIGYGYESVIGPVQVKYSFSPDSKTEDRIFISVGYWF